MPVAATSVATLVKVPTGRTSLAPVTRVFVVLLLVGCAPSAHEVAAELGSAGDERVVEDRAPAVERAAAAERAEAELAA
ncbi:MAG: hypothetical protein AB8I08_26745 [Sandaracinaceae bacterium]